MATENRIYIKSRGSDTTDAANTDIKIGEMALNANSGKLFIGTKLGDADGTYPGGASDEAMWVGAGILDEDTLVSDSATKLATQQSIKAYVDGVSAGLDIKESVVAASMQAVLLTDAGVVKASMAVSGSSGAEVLTSLGGTIAEWVEVFDGLAAANWNVSGKRVLLMTCVPKTGGIAGGAASAPTTDAANGVYEVTRAIVDDGVELQLTRVSDMNTAGASGEVSSGMYIFVEQGATLLNNSYVLKSSSNWTNKSYPNALSAGITNTAANELLFVQYSGAGQISAGVGLTKTADELKVTTGGVVLAMMASQSVDEDNLLISNAGSNGQFLSKQSGDAGGLTWAAAASSDVDVSVGNLEARLVQIDTATTIGDGVTMTMGGDLVVLGNDISYDAAASTLGVAAASGADVASGALTISAGTGTGDEIGGAITLKTGGAAGASSSTATTAVSALVLSATGGATFLNTVAAGGNITGNNLSGTNTGDNAGFENGGALTCTTIGATGLITCDDITAAADAITPGSGVSSTGGFNFTPGGVTEYNGGTHVLLAGMTINPLAVTNHASGTVTTMATLHLDGVPTHTGSSFTNAYSLWCGGTDGVTADGRIGGAIISGGTY